MVDHTPITSQHHEDDINLEKIVSDAVEKAAENDPQVKVSMKTKIALGLAGAVVVANAGLGIYNSITVQQGVNCNHQLQGALSVVADQNRVITKNIIDVVLTGKNPETGAVLSRADLIKLKDEYDVQFDQNNDKRQQLLRTTCQ